MADLLCQLRQWGHISARASSSERPAAGSIRPAPIPRVPDILQHTYVPL